MLRLKLRGVAHSNPTGESQSESTAGQHRVAKSPIAAALPILSWVSAWDLSLPSPVRLRQMVLQSAMATIF